MEKVWNFMKKFTTILFLSFIVAGFNMTCFASEHSGMPANEALEKLQIGNNHFVHVRMKHPDETKKRREELEKGQHPFVAILSCSDSRVPPEIIFDQGLGDIFEIRNAGNVVDEHVIGSIEYAVVHAGVKLVVVMGHEDCGAVKATIGHVKESNYIESLTKAIEPAVKVSQGTGNELVTDTAKNSAKMAVENILKSDPIISEYVKSHGVKVVPAIYHIHTGVVEFL